MKLIHASAALGLMGVAACSPAPSPRGGEHMFAALSQYCGQAFEGHVTSEDPRDADWATQTLTLHFRDCSNIQIRAPLHVGDDASRTWLISRETDGLRLQHVHRHEDGSEDAVSLYGGSTIAPPLDGRAEFPADEFSRNLFEREGIAASMANVWSLTLSDETLVYALDRPDRHFEASFDLTRPVDTPPDPWGG